MSTYPIYFNECNVPQAGIDTISILINPDIVKKHSLFHEFGNNNSPINLRIKKYIDPITKRTIQTNYFIDIQAEMINYNFNIRSQIVHYILYLFKSEILSINNHDESFVIDFVNNNFNLLFALDFIDFYFDIKEEDAVILGEISQQHPNTQYCKDGRIKTYNRQLRLKQKNNLPHDLINQIPLPRRIEFHLKRRTCPYLDINNLNGDFNVVFRRYLFFLARKWRKYKRYIIDIPNLKESNYYYLKLIENVAFSSTIPHTKSLLKPEPFKKVKKDKANQCWL